MASLKTLVILAAGNGSRFGGGKQFTRFGTLEQTLVYYNIHHAMVSGFDHFVFISQQHQVAKLQSEIIDYLPKHVAIDIVIQSLNDLPSGCHISVNRTKPLGTAHAIWCAREVVKQDFVVINADDYYGKSAFELLSTQHPTHTGFTLVGYPINKTLTDHGGVNRGLCQFDNHMQLVDIFEVTNIHAKGKQIFGTNPTSQELITIDSVCLVSMNCWAFSQNIFAALAHEIRKTFTQPTTIDQESYLPNAVMTLVQQDKFPVQVLVTSDKWFGITYLEDIGYVEKQINQLIAKGDFTRVC